MGIMHSFSQRGAVVVNLGFGVKITDNKILN